MNDSIIMSKTKSTFAVGKRLYGFIPLIITQEELELSMYAMQRKFEVRAQTAEGLF